MIIHIILNTSETATGITCFRSYLSSLDMLEKAKTSYPDIDFIKGDIAHFSPIEKIDCLFANASLQWLDEHQILIPKLLQLMNSGGALFLVLLSISVKQQIDMFWHPLEYPRLLRLLLYLPWYRPYCIIYGLWPFTNFATRLQYWKQTNIHILNEKVKYKSYLTY